MEKKSRDVSRKSVNSEEHFILAKGLNDVLIALGIAFLTFGILVQIFLQSLGGAFLAGERSLPMALSSGLGLFLYWGLSEYLTGYRKLALPSMILALGITIFSYMFITFLLVPSLSEGFSVGIGNSIALNSEQFSSIFFLKSMAAVSFPIAVLLLYYWRFKLPFALFMVAITLIFATFVFFMDLFPEWSPFKTGIEFLLLAGCSTFLWAMRLDLKDPLRQTRFADCAFWLHLLAAPLIVGSLTAMLIPDLSFPSSYQAALLFFMIFSLGVISLIIDRRSLFMAGLFYLGTSIAYAARFLMGHSELNSSVFSVTLITLGAFVVFLGVGWVPVRRLLIRTCIPTWMARRLRPVSEEILPDKGS